MNNAPAAETNATNQAIVGIVQHPEQGLVNQGKLLVNMDKLINIEEKVLVNMDKLLGNQKETLVQVRTLLEIQKKTNWPLDKDHRDRKRAQARDNRRLQHKD